MIRWLKQSWFGLSLVALLVLALPGLYLFFLNLIGQETEVNNSLEKLFNLSYHIPIPWWGALLLFLVPPLPVAAARLPRQAHPRRPE